MKKKKMILVLIILLLTTAALCGFFYIRAYITAQQEVSEYSKVQQEHTTIVAAPVYEPTVSPDAAPAETTLFPYILVDFDALLLENPDTVGWLAIPDTVINYPVVQTTDNIKYLNVSFQGNRSSAGAPFANKDNNMRDLDANTVIYGHNMGFGRQDMFGALLSYKDSDFYAAHRYLQFDTVYQTHGWWKVFAVISYDLSADGFQYQQLQFTGTDGFIAWVKTALELSLYGSDTEISPDDHILTLSTCDRSKYGKNGRLLVLAVDITD